MSRKIIINNTEKNKNIDQFSQKKIRRLSSPKPKVKDIKKFVHNDISNPNDLEEKENIKKINNSEYKHVLIPKKQGYEKNPELYISEGEPIMTFDKTKKYDKKLLDKNENNSPYKSKQKKIKGIDPRTPSEKFQEYKSDKLEYGCNNVLYKGKIYKIKDEYFIHFIKQAENALYSNIGSRNWARKVAEKELKENGIDIKDNRIIVLPVDLKINGEKIDLPDYDEKELEKSVSSVPLPTMGL